MKRLMILMAVFGIVVAACGGSGGTLDDTSDTVGDTTAPVVGDVDVQLRGSDLDATVEFAIEPESASFQAVGPFQVPPPGLSEAKVIRDAAVDVRVAEGEFEAKWADVRQIAADLGGYVSDANTGIRTDGEERYAFGSLTLRVPEDRFDDAVDQLSGLGEQLGFTMTGQDVSEEFVDLESRLRHWKATESFLLGLMEEATTIDEALRLQGELAIVQLTIEQLEGRLNYLEARTSFSSITANLTEAPDVAAPFPDEATTPSELEQALTQARQVLMGIFSFIIVAAAAVVPVAGLGLVALGLYRVGQRIAKKQQPAEG